MPVLTIQAVEAKEWKALSSKRLLPHGWEHFKVFTVSVTPGECGARVKPRMIQIYAFSEFHARMYCHLETEIARMPLTRKLGEETIYALSEKVPA
jgi:hypothetical protein